MIEYNFGSLKDAGSVAALHADNWRKYYRGALSDYYLDQEVKSERQSYWIKRLTEAHSGECLITAYQGNELAGFVYSFSDYDEHGSYLDNLHVHESSHGYGIGRNLMSKSAQWLLDQGSNRPYYLWVLESNDGAIEFYNKMKGEKCDIQLHTMPDGSRCKCVRYVWENIGLLIGYDEKQII